MVLYYSAIPHIAIWNLWDINVLSLNGQWNLVSANFPTVCTSTDDPLPVTITEAIFSKRLVLVSSGTGHYKTIENYGCGFTYTVNDIDGLSHALEEALSLSKDDYRSITRKAFDTFTTYFSEDDFKVTLKNEVIGFCRDSYTPNFGQKYDS